jgi:transcription antitermination factor NusG
VYRDHRQSPRAVTDVAIARVPAASPGPPPPDALTPLGRSKECLGRAWLAVWTKARAEKAVARTLADRSVEHWLPLVTVRRQWSDRWKLVEMPLLPGYLFARVGPHEWSSLLPVSGVLTVVKYGAAPACIRPDQIAQLRDLVERLGVGEDVPEVHEFEPGAVVRVVSGPLAGLRGVVREVRGQRRLLVGIDQIGKAVAVNIGASQVRGDGPPR